MDKSHQKQADIGSDNTEDKSTDYQQAYSRKKVGFHEFKECLHLGTIPAVDLSLNGCVERTEASLTHVS